VTDRYLNRADRTVSRYRRDYDVRIYSRSSGADLSGLFGVSRFGGPASDGVSLYSTSRSRGLGPDDARDVVLDYFIRRGYDNAFLLDLRIDVTPSA
jgi:hypothetical protein